MAKSNSKANNNAASVGGVAFVGCLFLGMGLGALVDQTGAGTLLGLGAGFVVMAILRNRN